MCNKNMGIKHYFETIKAQRFFSEKTFSSLIGGLRHNDNNCRMKVVKRIKL